SVGLGQVDALPGAGRYLAARLGKSLRAARRDADDAAAAPVFPDCFAGRRDQLSGGAWDLHPRATDGGAERGRAAGDDGAAGRRSALEPHAVARRATTAL